MSAQIISLVEWRKGVRDRHARCTADRRDKKAIIQALLNDIARNLGVDLGAPAAPPQPRRLQQIDQIAENLGIDPKTPFRSPPKSTAKPRNSPR